MKKTITIFFSSFIVCMHIAAQNVGVGTNTPTQKLDVAGNINTSGNLMVNGVAGTDGQVLTMNGGTMQWMDKSRFKNWAIYTTTGASTFNVPAGVNEILIEMWGAGGGGHSAGGGGGSGGYWIGLIPVAGIAIINLSIGIGGSPGSLSTPGTSGANTSFSCTGFNVSTGGGSGADSSKTGNVEFYYGGAGGFGMVTGAVLPTGYRNYFFLHGNRGSSTSVSFIQTSTGSFAKMSLGGVGGTAPFSGKISKSPTYLLDNPSATSVRGLTNGSDLPDFGEGGTPQFLSTGGNGGNGRIIIYY